MILKKLPIILSSITTIGLMAACGPSTNDGASGDGQKGTIVFIDSANFDFSVKPGDDFFQYANGAWLKNTKIPAAKPRWGSFDELRERTDNSVKELLISAKENSNDITEANIANFYASGMDSTKINAAGLTAIQPVLDGINKITDVPSLLDVVYSNAKQGLNTVMGMHIDTDDKDVTVLIPKFYQTGLGLPNKDYYTEQDAKSVAIRADYVTYIAAILKIAGQDETAATANATKIFELENKLAAASLRPQEARDPHKLYNKFLAADYSKKTSNIDWVVALDKLGLKDQDSIIIAMPQYYQALSTLLQSVAIEDWKNYLTFHTISDMSSYLTDEIAATSFDFYGKKLKGVTEQEPRWQRVKSVINGAIGDQLGALYVKKYFKPEAKEKMMTLVKNLENAFEERIQALDWMSDVTKDKAMGKLKSFITKIGYPDKWKDYSKLAIGKENYAMNVLNAFAFEYNYDLAKLGKPVDKTEWFMTPNTVNAYYNPAFNEIVFPAAILQFPFFDFDADDALNYGGIGAVIGHEMTHGFDDQGAQYAADGNLSDWWTSEDKAKFKAKTQVLVNQYNAFMVQDSLRVNGELTLGENIADVGGLAIAYQAFKKTPQGQSNELIDGFTPDQRFFLSWAQIWRGVATPEFAVQLLKTDVHSPSAARANVPLSNFDAFYKAFDVKEGDKMYRPESERAKIW